LAQSWAETLIAIKQAIAMVTLASFIVFVKI
jgi:hypothetical protein